MNTKIKNTLSKICAASFHSSSLERGGSLLSFSLQCTFPLLLSSSSTGFFSGSMHGPSTEGSLSLLCQIMDSADDFSSVGHSCEKLNNNKNDGCYFTETFCFYTSFICLCIVFCISYCRDMKLYYTMGIWGRCAAPSDGPGVLNMPGFFKYMVYERLIPFNQTQPNGAVTCDAACPVSL